MLPFTVIGLLLDSTCTSVESLAVSVVIVGVPVLVLAGAFSLAPEVNAKVCPLAPPSKWPFTVTPETLKVAFGARNVPLNVVPLVPVIVSLS